MTTLAQIYRIAARFIPESRREEAEPYIGAVSAVFARVYVLLAALDLQIEVWTATGQGLDKVGEGYGMHRTQMEPDTRYRRRLVSVGQGVTRPRIQTVLDRLLALGGYPPAVIIAGLENYRYLDVTYPEPRFYLDNSRLPAGDSYTVLVDNSVPDQVIYSILRVLYIKTQAGVRFFVMRANLGGSLGATFDSTTITFDSTDTTWDQT